MSSANIRGSKPVIGVTGAIGSGKSTVASCFAKWGAMAISGDEIGHAVLSDSRPVRSQLIRAFGSDIVVDGSIDRTQLAHRAFARPSNVLKLNRIVHPALIRRINQEVRTGSRRPSVCAVVIDAALLVEWGMGKIHWDYLVGVEAPYDLRISRLRARGMTISQIRRFSAAQMPWQKKRGHCDFIVKNDASLTILQRRTRLCWDKMLSCD